MNKNNKYLEYLEQIAKSKGINPLTNEIKSNALLFPIAFKELQELIDEKYNKPTEEEVLKEFEELGYKHKFFDNSLKLLTLYKPTKGHIYQIDIYESKKYYFDFGLTLQEHQLLTKLFRAWGWFNE